MDQLRLFLARNQIDTVVPETAVEKMWRELQELLDVERQMKLKSERGTAKWTRGVTNSVGASSVLKNWNVVQFLESVGRYKYWQNGEILEPKFIGGTMSGEIGGVSVWVSR